MSKHWSDAGKQLRNLQDASRRTAQLTGLAIDISDLQLCKRLGFWYHAEEPPARPENQPNACVARVHGRHPARRVPPTGGRTVALANQWHKLTAARPGPRSPGTIPTCSANGLLSISGQRLDLAVRHGAHHGFGSKCGAVQCNGSAAKWCGTRLWGRAERCCNPGRPPKGVVPQPLNSGGQPPLGARIKGVWRSVLGVRGVGSTATMSNTRCVFTSAPPSQGRKDSLSAVQPKPEHSPYTLLSSLTNVACSPPRLSRYADALTDADSALFGSPRV